MNKIIIFLCAFMAVNVCHGQVLYKNTFDDKPDWVSGAEGTGGLSNTHTEATTVGFSEVMVAGDKINGPNLFEIGDSYGKTGKGLAWRIESYSLAGARADYWTGGRLDLHFADTDNVESGVSATGYDELWISYWANYGAFNWGQSPIFKIMRYYSNDGGTSYQDVWDSSTHGALSDHYNPDGSYKEPHQITDWSGWSDPYYFPTYCADNNNPLDGCTTLNARPPIAFSTGVQDNTWHFFEHHIKLNTIGQDDLVQDMYIDGVLFGSLTADIELRLTENAKIDHLIFFDNHQVDSGGDDDIEQTIMIDDLTVSTTRDYSVAPAASTYNFGWIINPGE